MHLQQSAVRQLTDRYPWPSTVFSLTGDVAWPAARSAALWAFCRRATHVYDSFYHARMARRAQHLRCSLSERSERGDNKLDNDSLRFARGAGVAHSY